MQGDRVKRPTGQCPSLKSLNHPACCISLPKAAQLARNPGRDDGQGRRGQVAVQIKRATEKMDKSPRWGLEVITRCLHLQPSVFLTT